MPTNSPDYYTKNNWENAKKYYDNPKAREKSKMRKRARRILERQWKVKVNDWKEVDHKNWNPHDNRPSNLQVLSKYKNRLKWAMKANKKKWSGYKKNV